MIEFVPAGKALVVKVIRPDPSSVPEPRAVAPFLNVTIPVGMPVPGDTATTMFVNVTDWPKQAGLSKEKTVEVVFAALTVKGLLVAGSKPDAEAMRVLLMPAVAMLNVLKVAEPLATVATMVVPFKIPLLKVSEMFVPLFETLFPN